MGNFYTNITLVTDEREPVVDFLRKNSHGAYVTELEDKFVCVFPEDDGILFDIAKQLSELFKCSALAVLNHDDDVLMYHLYDNGKQLDEYNSCPGYFDGNANSASGGDAQALSGMYNSKVVHARVQEILAGAFTSATERHEALTGLLNLPTCTVGSGYNYITGGDVTDDLNLDSLTLIESDNADEQNLDLFKSIKAERNSAQTNAPTSRVLEMLKEPEVTGVLLKAQARAKELLKDSAD